MSDGTVSGGQGVLVTGASSGIGAAIARQLASRGYVVGCVSRRGTVDPAVAGLMALQCDITDPAALDASMSRFGQRCERFVGLVNSAGIHRSSSSADLELADLRLVLETNFVSTFGVCQSAYPYLVRHGGVIVNIGSFYDRLGVPSNLAYSASKAALASMTRTLAVEWAADGIAVITVAPGYVLTELNRGLLSEPARLHALQEKIPRRRIGTVDEVATLVAAIIQTGSTFLTGTTIYMDGGQEIGLQATI